MTMTTFLGIIGEVVTAMVGMFGEILTLFTTSVILQLGIGIMICSAVIGLAMRLLHRN